MKKYLITGALALVACTILTGCHADEEFTDVIANKLQTYEEVFKEEFGEINPSQDWGFGAASQMARLHAARTRTANKNLNQWGDPAYGNWDVPPTLTEGQKLRVKAYFQAHPRLTYIDPKLKNFFVQQVYKGNPVTKGALSPEEYTRTNGETVTGSDHMDWLYAGTSNDHINDFNDGEWNGGTPLKVLNTGANTNDYEKEGCYHLDQITLMENSSTEYIAYGSTDGSVYHTDCCALAGAKAIDDWALAQDPVIGDNVWYDDEAKGLENQKWNRSFVGLDYEAKKRSEIVSGKGNAKAKDFCVSDYILYNGQIYLASEFADFELKDQYFNNVEYIKDDVSNMSIAEYVKYQSGTDESGDPVYSNVTKDTYNYNISKSEFANYGITISNEVARVYNLNMVVGYARDGALPTDNNGNWVKNIGGRDYVFSDWIVTLTPAKKQLNNPDTITIPIEPGTPGSDKEETWIYYRYKRQLNSSGRILCEDLGVIRASDIDFNDIVFDAYIYDMIPYKRTVIKKNDQDFSDSGWIIDDEHSSYAYRFADIFVLAGGGTLETSVAGQNFKGLWGKETENERIINTINEETGSYGNPWANNNAYGKILKYEMTMSQGLVDIPIVVSYNNHPLLLQANPGVAPHKICVPIETPWPFERIEIKETYPGFTKYVGSRGAYSVDPNQANKIVYNPDECWDNPTEDTYYVGDGQITHKKYSQELRAAATDDSDISEAYFEKIDDLPDYYYKKDAGTNGGYNSNDPVLVRRRR
jgi:hypothetical protein